GDRLDSGELRSLLGDSRGHLEREQGLLELELRACRADRGVRDLGAERDRGLGVLRGHDLGLRERRRLVLRLEGVEDEVDVELAADEPEGDARWRTEGSREDREVDDVAA